MSAPNEAQIKRLLAWRARTGKQPKICVKCGAARLIWDKKALRYWCPDCRAYVNRKRSGNAGE